VIGYQLGSAFHTPGSYWGVIGTGIGTILAFLVIAVEHGLGKVSLRGLSAAVFGLILAFIVSRFLSGAIDLIPELDLAIASALKLVLVVILSYFGMIFSMRGRDEFNLIIPYVKFDRQDQKDALLISTRASSSTGACWTSAKRSSSRGVS
jgi:uncharacterized protein YacL